MASSIAELDDDCLSLILGQLGAVDRLCLERVSRRFQKCMYRVVEALMIAVGPVKIANQEINTAQDDHSLKACLEFNRKRIYYSDFFLPVQFLTIAPKLTHRIMQLSVIFCKVTDEMLDAVKGLSCRSLKVTTGNLSEAKTDSLFGGLGNRITSLEIVDWIVTIDQFRAEWALRWFQSDVFKRIVCLTFSHKDFLEHFEAFDQAWQTTLPSHARFKLVFHYPKDLASKLQKVSPWLGERIIDFGVIEDLFEDSLEEIAKFANLRKLEFDSPYSVSVRIQSQYRTLEAFQALAKGCKQLKSLELTFYDSRPAATWQIFKALFATLTEFRSLKKLAFSARGGNEVIESEESKKVNIWRGFAKSALESFYISYNPPTSDSWHGFGRHLPKTLKKFSFNGKAAMVDTLVEYHPEGNLEDVFLKVNDRLNESALLDFVKSARKLNVIKIDCVGNVISETFRNTFDIICNPDTKVDILAKNTRITIGHPMGRPFYPRFT